MALGRLGKGCRSLLHEPCKVVFCGVIQPGWVEGCLGAKRHLLSEDVLRLQDFQQKKLAMAHLLTRSEGNFIDLFSQKLLRNECILPNDLKLLLHLCNSADDMQVARDAIYRYHAENHKIALRDFKFGPLFMRLCYELDMDGIATATLTDESIKGFFNDSTSMNIVLDMLFIKGLYERGLEVVRTMKNRGVKFNKETLILATGVCYKLNTAESYKICTALLEETRSKGYLIPRHAQCFAAALALHQNELEKAQTIVSQIIQGDTAMCQNLKVLILVKSGAVADAVSILSAAILPGPSFLKKPEFSQEVVELLSLRSDGGPQMTKVEQIVTRLQQTGQVTWQTLDQMLCPVSMGKRRPVPMVQEKRINRRTQSSIKSYLLSE